MANFSARLYRPLGWLVTLSLLVLLGHLAADMADASLSISSHLHSGGSDCAAVYAGADVPSATEVQHRLPVQFAPMGDTLGAFRPVSLGVNAAIYPLYSLRAFSSAISLPLLV